MISGTSVPGRGGSRIADLVLEGGGVKGIALVGAATALDEAGWRFARVAGSSAGALVGAIIAAMQQAGEPMTRVDDIMRTIDYRQMLDRRGFGRVLRHLPRAADAWGIIFHLGMHRGAYLRDWTSGVLADLGVRSFGDLAFDDPGRPCRRGSPTGSSSPRATSRASVSSTCRGTCPPTASTPTGSRSPGRSAPRPPSRSCSSRFG